VERILIIKPSSLGDIIHTLPLVHAIKRCKPESSLGWVVQRGFSDLLERDPAIDRVYLIDISSTSDPMAGRNAYSQAFKETMISLWHLHGELARSYDTVLDLHASFRSGLIGLAATGAQRIGFKDARELNTLFQHRVIAVPGSVDHALEKNLLFASHCGCQTVDDDYHICSNEADQEAVASFLRGKNISSQRRIIYANPAARWQTKFWPKEYWAQLADCVYENGNVLVFSGSGHDCTFIGSITALMHSPPVVAAGHFSLPETVALLKQSSLYVGLDSGPMHMAAMASVPVVALFGPTHPARVGPYNVEHKIVRAEDLSCLECRKRTCDHLSCMKNISVTEVHEAVISLLDK